MDKNQELNMTNIEKDYLINAEIVGELGYIAPSIDNYQQQIQNIEKSVDITRIQIKLLDKNRQLVEESLSERIDDVQLQMKSLTFELDRCNATLKSVYEQSKSNYNRLCDIDYSTSDTKAKFNALTFWKRLKWLFTGKLDL